MNLDNKKRIAVLRVLYLCTAIYVMMIAAVSHIPSALLGHIDLWDKIAHLLEYIPLGILVTGSLTCRTNSPHYKSIFVSSLCILAIFGMADEAHQFFVPGRNVSLGDVTADILGGSIGALLVGCYCGFAFRNKSTR